MQLDPRTAELSAAHDTLAPTYRSRLAGLLETMPIEQAVLELFATLVRSAGAGVDVADVGCGTGRLLPFLAECGLSPSGVDLSPEMVATARADHPGVDVERADVRQLPYRDGALGGVVCWYSLMYLPLDDRRLAFAEIARVLAPGGHLAMAYKQGDDLPRRAGRSLGVEFDIWWHSEAEVEQRVDQVGMRVVFRGGRPPDPGELQPQGYLIAVKPR